MVKFFSTNKDGKIEFTKDDLEKLLNEVWWDGKNANNYYWTSPSYTTTCGATRWGDTSHTVSGSNIYNGATGVTVSLKGEDDG